MNHPPCEQVSAGRIAHDAVALGIALCRDAIDGERLDKEIETFIRDESGTPALKGYQPGFSKKPYLHTICLALDKEAVHGPPVKQVSPDKLITIDLVVELEGWHADTARTFSHSGDPARIQFAEASRLIHDLALDAIGPQQCMSLYGSMVELGAKTQGYAIIEKFCGHGIGRSIHEAPQVLNYFTPTTELFRVGRAYAVEPVIAYQSDFQLGDGPDGWTIQTDCMSSHNEDTVFITEHGALNLTGGKDE